MNLKYTRNSKKNSLRPYLAIAIVLIVLVGGATYLKYHHINNSKGSMHSANSLNYPAPTSSENAAGNDRKSSTSPSTTLDNGTSTQHNSASFTVSIVNASVVNNNVHVGTLVSGTTAGSCTLTANMAGKSDIIRTSSVQRDVNNYDCGIFNIPVAYFTTNGTWTLTLAVSDNGKQATSSSSVDINTN